MLGFLLGVCMSDFVSASNKGEEASRVKPCLQSCSKGPTKCEYFWGHIKGVFYALLVYLLIFLAYIFLEGRLPTGVDLFMCNVVNGVFSVHLFAFCLFASLSLIIVRILLSPFACLDNLLDEVLRVTSVIFSGVPVGISSFFFAAALAGGVDNLFYSGGLGFGVGWRHSLIYIFAALLVLFYSALPLFFSLVLSGFYVNFGGNLLKRFAVFASSAVVVSLFFLEFYNSGGVDFASLNKVISVCSRAG